MSVDPMVNETNQPYAYVGDDPVNGVDPNGLAPYSYTFNLGLGGVPPSTLAIFFQQDCSWVFPLAGCTNDFEVNQTLHLNEKLAGITESFPVCVAYIGSTSITFVALPGHPEGAGRTITFTFEQGTSGEDLLNVSTSSNGSLLAKAPLDILDFPIAHQTWENLANGFNYAYADYQYNKQQGTQWA